MWLLRAAHGLPVLAAILRPPTRLAAVPFACAAAPAGVLGDQLQAWVQKSLAAEQRKRASLAKEAEAALRAEKLGQWATLVVANLYRIDEQASSAVVEDWENDGQPIELRFDSGDGTPREQADAAFAKARRLRRGSAVVAALVQQSETVEAKLLGWQLRIQQHAAADPAPTEDSCGALLYELRRDAKKLKLKADELEALGGAWGALPGVSTSGSLPRGQRSVTQPPPLAPSRTSGWRGREFVSPAGVQTGT